MEAMRAVKTIMIRLVLILAPIFILAAEVDAKDLKYGSDLPFMKGSLIEIKSWDPETRTFQAFSPLFPGEGESYVTPEGLARGIDSIDLKRVLKNPSSFVGNQYKTDRELPTLFSEERQARRKEKKPTK